MLRQGKSAVQALHELEILTTDYVGENTLLPDRDLGTHSTSNPMTVCTIVRGRLHIRTGSIGKYRKAFLPSQNKDGWYIHCFHHKISNL